MPDALESLLLHPLAVIAHICRKTGCALPAGVAAETFLVFRIDRRHPRKPGRDLDHRLIDHDSDRVQVVSVCLQTEALRFQRNRSTTRKGIEQRRRVSAGRLHDLRFRSIQHFLVIGVLPLHQLFQNAEQALTLLVLLLLRREFLRMRGRIVHQ